MEQYQDQPPTPQTTTTTSTASTNQSPAQTNRAKESQEPSSPVTAPAPPAFNQPRAPDQTGATVNPSRLPIPEQKFERHRGTPMLQRTPRLPQGIWIANRFGLNSGILVKPPHYTPDSQHPLPSPPQGNSAHGAFDPAYLTTETTLPDHNQLHTTNSTTTQAQQQSQQQQPQLQQPMPSTGMADGAAASATAGAAAGVSAGATLPLAGLEPLDLEPLTGNSLLQPMRPSPPPATTAPAAAVTAAPAAATTAAPNHQSAKAFNTREFGYPKPLDADLRLPVPKTKEALEQRLNQLVGRSIGELALLAGVDLPYSNHSGKGFAGQLIELYLGASAYNLTLPDFTELNIELKTVPVDVNLLPVESTFICSIDLRSESFVAFEQSPLYHKLAHMLFVLLLAPKGFPITERRVLGYFYFTPDAEQLQSIRADYQEFADLVCTGNSDAINSSMGSIIQMRPKGLSSDSLIQARDSEGNPIYTKPRGFYLRRSFTLQLCQQFLQEQQVTEQELAAFRERLAIPSLSNSNDFAGS